MKIPKCKQSVTGEHIFEEGQISHVQGGGFEKGETYTHVRKYLPVCVLCELVDTRIKPRVEKQSYTFDGNEGYYGGSGD